VMLGQDGAAIGTRAARRQRAGRARRRQAGGGGVGVPARARTPEGMQPTQAAAFELDHAGAAQVGDARDLASRVRPRAADAGAQREDAALGPWDA
jgi:hypothetical protein